MNIRETGSRSARRVTTALAVIGAAVASVIGVSIWAGSTASASTNTSTGIGTVQGDGGQNSDDGGLGSSNGVAPQNSGSVSPGQGGGSHGFSSGS